MSVAGDIGSASERRGVAEQALVYNKRYIKSTDKMQGAVLQMI